METQTDQNIGFVVGVDHQGVLYTREVLAWFAAMPDLEAALRASELYKPSLSAYRKKPKNPNNDQAEYFGMTRGALLQGLNIPLRYRVREGQIDFLHRNPVIEELVKLPGDFELEEKFTGIRVEINSELKPRIIAYFNRYPTCGLEMQSDQLTLTTLN